MSKNFQNNNTEEKVSKMSGDMDAKNLLLALQIIQ